MTWKSLSISSDGTHHLDPQGRPLYDQRFDRVLKFHQPGLAPVQRGNKAWHITVEGKAAYLPRFTRTFGFYEGLAAVVDAEGWFHINSHGRSAYPERWSWCGNFQEGRCAVRERGGTYAHINTEGQMPSEKRWKYVGDYREGVAVVQEDDGRSTHLDLLGQHLHGHWFLDLDVYHKGFARARNHEGWFHVDRQGIPIYSHRFAAIEPFYNGQARVECWNGTLAVIDEDGQTLQELRPPLCSDFAQLSSDLVGFWKTQTLAAAVAVGLPDILPATTEAVATRCGLDPERTLRFLRALGELRCLKRTEETWFLTPRGEFLQRAHPMTLADAALEYADPFTRLWAELPRALSKDSGWIPPDLFQQVSSVESRKEAHHRMLRSYALHDYPPLLGALEFRAGERIVDAGGGVGILARLLVEAHPSLDVTVLERPEVVALGQRENPHPRLRWHQGDLFQPWGLHADVVILSRILHDWDDRRAALLLQHARHALSKGGRLLIIENLVSPTDFAGSLCDIHLLVALGGEERPLPSYERLLGEGGFALTRVQRVTSLSSLLVGVAQ